MGAGLVSGIFPMGVGPNQMNSTSSTNSMNSRSIPHTRGDEPGELQEHHTNQACHKSGIMPPKYHAIFSIRANRRIVLQTLFKTVLHLLMTDRVRVKELSLA
jgi:hypothetical protein